MNVAESADGTRIAFVQTGGGPPLVIVLGAFCDSSTSKSLASLLAPAYTVYEYDRRGRGASGAGVSGSVESEVEDLAAVLAAAGQPAYVYGHSSGGALALEAAARGVEMRRLAVYEPPYTGAHHPGAEFGKRLDELVAAGRRDQAAEQWLAMAGTPSPIIDSIKRSPGWAHRLALAHTLSQDLRLAGDGHVPTERLGRIGVPVLVLAGAASPAWAAATSASLVGAVPRASAQVVEGQQHVPDDSILAAILSGFFR